MLGRCTDIEAFIDKTQTKEHRATHMPGSTFCER